MCGGPCTSMPSDEHLYRTSPCQAALAENLMMLPLRSEMMLMGSDSMYCLMKSTSLLLSIVIFLGVAGLVVLAPEASLPKVEVSGVEVVCCCGSCCSHACCSRLRRNLTGIRASKQFHASSLVACLGKTVALTLLI